MDLLSSNGQSKMEGAKDSNFWEAMTLLANEIDMSKLD